MNTASPARLRLMLIERAVELSSLVAELWRKGENQGPNEHSLKLFEIINELLSGVTDKDSEVCQKVADLYVFLAQHLIRAEQTSDANSMDEIRTVLLAEAETWRMVCVQEAPKHAAGAAASTSPAAGLNLQG